MNRSYNGPERRSSSTQLLDPLLTEVEAAEALKVQPNTLAKSRTGRGGIKIPYVKLGKGVRYLRSDLENFVRNNRFSNTAEALSAKIEPS